MHPLTITVYDRNVRHMLSDDNQSSSHHTPDGNSHAMFPTNIKYVFEDDDTSLAPTESENDDGIENMIIVNLEESGTLSGVELISDQFEMLSYKGVTSGNDPMVDDVELEVVSQFTDLSNLVHDLPLDELIRLYVIQNEQMQTISNSM
ncbi:hypothetical protein ZYGR_0A01520 [Zygosaccharomyces rouxii]|uniref:ZYRO0A03454p n=2 Tax=Zygosaccharomyces rouxii TaxID=4956 RepID=C5DPH6_ZYGRC|nr:uncharacterized protein ZYRO0A03454g [Zygosaccharomyces rouxii]KAH9198892.1 autophagy-related protein 31 [Zygosaccharomyces rouxii]GAV46560.1 hypothetical protein ZYGR_0A01520 [Zygosaccharomyces rouxii]CAR25587.1 ZYRO0A03454p [Zygosaccharomyces rouxii]